MARFCKDLVVLIEVLSLSLIDLSLINGQNFSINSGTTFSGDKGLIAIQGNLISDGAFTNSNNTIVLNGSAQTISGSSEITFNNLILNGTGVKTISSGTSVTVDSSLETGNSLEIQSSSLTSSGSLIVMGTTTGTLTYNRQLLTESTYGDYQYISSPVYNNTAANSGKITDVYSWDEITGTWPYESITNLTSGQGYNIDQTAASDGLISFTGSMATSAIIPATSPYKDSITGTEPNYDNRKFINATGHSGVARSLSNYGGGGWNMLGNPFTSAILASDFISANYNPNPALSNFDPNYVALYIYDPTVVPHGLYYYISNTSGWWGTQLLQTHIQVGQGFFVVAMNDFSNFNFLRSMQNHSTTDAILKSTKTEGRWSGVFLKVKYGDSENHTLILYHEGMTTGLDPSYDIGLLSTSPPLEMYTLLVRSNTVRFAQQALPIEGCDTIVVPVGIDYALGGEVRFFAETEPLENYTYFLEDRTTGTYTDISTDTYTVTLDAGTFGTGRFFIHTKKNGSTDIDPVPADNNMSGLKIWTTNNTIVIKGEVSSKAIAAVYDIQGRMIYENILNEGPYNALPIGHASKGIYIVRVIDGDKVTTKKINL
jgi:trimeric autotransporter adhesin